MISEIANHLLPGTSDGNHVIEMRGYIAHQSIEPQKCNSTRNRTALYDQPLSSKGRVLEPAVLFVHM